MADQDTPSDRDALDDLARRVAEARRGGSATDRAGAKAPADMSGMSLGLRLASEFVSAIIVGGLIGFGIDALVRTSPAGLLVGFGLGFAAGTVNMVRAARAVRGPARLNDDG